VAHGVRGGLADRYVWSSPGRSNHLSARGDRQEPIVEDDHDRLDFLDPLARDYKL